MPCRLENGENSIILVARQRLLPVSVPLPFCLMLHNERFKIQSLVWVFTNKRLRSLG